MKIGTVERLWKRGDNYLEDRVGLILGEIKFLSLWRILSLLWPNENFRESITYAFYILETLCMASAPVFHFVEMFHILWVNKKKNIKRPFWNSIAKNRWMWFQCSWEQTKDIATGCMQMKTALKTYMFSASAHLLNSEAKCIANQTIFCVTNYTVLLCVCISMPSLQVTVAVLCLETRCIWESGRQHCGGNSCISLQ